MELVLLGRLFGECHLFFGLSFFLRKGHPLANDFSARLVVFHVRDSLGYLFCNSRARPRITYGRVALSHAQTWRFNGIATCLYKADKCVMNQRETQWHLSQITDEIEPSERGRYVLGARRKSEREMRKLRCAKPSALKPRRRRMKPILD